MLSNLLFCTSFFVIEQLGVFASVFYLLFHTLLERNRVIGVVFIFFSVVIFEFLGNVGCI